MSMLSVKKEDFLDDLVDEVVNVAKKKRGKYPNTFQNQFINRRINAKYIELASRYAQFTDDGEIFGQMVMIIMELVKDKEYIKISKTGRNDEISWIITTVEQRMWDYIQKNYTMNFVARDGDGYCLKNNFVVFDDDGRITENRMVNLDDYTYIGNGNFISNHEIYNIGNNDPTEYEHMLGLQKLDELMSECKLTNNQKDIVLALEQTRDSDFGTYNITEAARLLNKPQQSVNKSWHNIKDRVSTALENEGAFDSLSIKTYYLFEDIIEFSETDTDIINWIKDNIDNTNIVNCLYEVSGEQRKEIIMAVRGKDYNKVLCSKGIICFLKEIHVYLRKYDESDHKCC